MCNQFILHMICPLSTSTFLCTTNHNQQFFSYVSISNNSSLFMSMSNLIWMNINIMEKVHVNWSFHIHVGGGKGMFYLLGRNEVVKLGNQVGMHCL